VGIIMDGNGRWATARGLSRSEGHRRGVESVREVVRTAREAGLSALTLYAFSAQNWGRPRAEVDHLMGLLRGFLEAERAELVRSGIRLCAIGDLGRLPATVRAPLALLERASATNRGMLLCLALSYDGRGALVDAARKLATEAAAGRLDPRAITEATFARALSTSRLPPLDLIVRTSGEQRLSNFLPWESAYAELYFTDVMWPDFGGADLLVAIEAYGRRQRRFGVDGSRAAGGR
jgi:undecaprenyl diphosphate synthase